MRRLALLLLLAAAACDTTAVEAGRARFADPRGFSQSAMAVNSCADCHATSAEPPAGLLLPGYGLHGALARKAYWGGQLERPIDAVNQCIVYFQQGAPLDEDSAEARQLFEYLASITPDDTPVDALPLTVVENIVAVPLGDATRGEALYRAACENCHDAAFSGGSGGLAEFALPEDTSTYPVDFPGVVPGLVVVEKIRHGRFFAVGGTMGFYAAEVMSDAQIGDILAFLELPSE